MMCVKQQQNSLNLTKAGVVAMRKVSLSPKVSDAYDETNSLAIKCGSSRILSESVVDDSEVDSQSSQAETQAPLKEPLTSERSFPITTRKSKRSTKKSVKFNQAVTCRPSLHKQDYSKQETKNSFYCRREFEMIRRELLQTLSLIQAGKFVEQDDDESVSTDFTVSTSRSSSSRSLESLHAGTSRGLENFTVKGSLKSTVKKLRHKSITNVLMEQDFQVDEAEAMNLTYLFYDDEAIRDSYIKYSKLAAEVARKRGIEDYHVSSGRVPQRTPVSIHTKKNFRNLFSKKSVSEKNMGKNSEQNANNKPQQHQPRQRRWSYIEKSTRSGNNSNGDGAPEKKPTTRRWSLRSVKQTGPAALIA